MKMKYRAWNRRDKRMLSAEEIESQNYALGSHGLMVAHERDSDHLWNIDHFLTPMMFTGICDRFGKEIYEGDVLNFKTWSNHFQDRRWFMAPVTFKNCMFYAEYQLNRIAQEETIEVIGNIYENEDILLGKEFKEYEKN